MDTWRLYKRALEAIGAQACADAIGVSAKHFYRLAANPEDPTRDDAVVVRDDMARLIALVERLSTYPHARPVVVEFEVAFEECFARIRNRVQALPLEDSTIAERAARLCKEFSDLLECMAVKKPEDCDPDRIEKEGAELIEVVKQAMWAARSTRRVDAIKRRSA